MRNYWRKPKIVFWHTSYKKITENRTFWQTVVPLFTKRRQKAKKLFLMKQKNIFLMIRKFTQFLITSFQTVCQTYLTIVIIFPQKAHIFSQLSLKRTIFLNYLFQLSFEKHPSILHINQKRKLDSVFSFRKTTQ